MEDMVVCLFSGGVFFNLFSCYINNLALNQVVVGTVAARGVRVDPDPLHRLQDAYYMFQSAAETSNRAARALVSDPKRCTRVPL